MKRLFKLLFIEPGKIFLVLKTFIILGLVRLGLLLLPFSNLQKLLVILSRLFLKLSSSNKSNTIGFTSLTIESRKELGKEVNKADENSISSFSRLDRLQINKIIWAVNVSSKYMPGKVKCLARALTTEFLMNRLGYYPELRIGIAKGETGKLEAHAWIESQGKVLIGQLEDLARFQVLPLPPIEVKQS